MVHVQHQKKELTVIWTPHQLGRYIEHLCVFYSHWFHTEDLFFSIKTARKYK